MPGVDWETCMTMNTTWGYSRHDHAWKSSQTLIRNLVDIASKGGNYLLNIGPLGDGTVPKQSVDCMKAIGRWMDTNGESIYGTTASPFAKLAWGRCTKKVAADGTTLYLHVFDWPADGKLVVPGLKNAVRTAKMLDGGKALKVVSGEAGPVVQLPASAPDADASVVVLAIDGRPRVE
jgi:alpha-L-fucosidase